jgi:hypothetical protein
MRILLAAAVLSAAAPLSAASLFVGNGHYYDFVADALSWHAALAAAAAATPITGFTAHLVTITSAPEDAFVKALSGSAVYVWAAGTDQAVEGTWKWAAGPESGQTFFIKGGPVVGYQHWNPGEPNNNATENFLHIKANTGDWNDIYPTFPSGGYVVEYSPNSAFAVPEPAGWSLMIAGFGLIGAAMRRRRPTPSVGASQCA